MTTRRRGEMSLRIPASARLGKVQLCARSLRKEKMGVQSCNIALATLELPKRGGYKLMIDKLGMQ